MSCVVEPPKEILLLTYKSPRTVRAFVVDILFLSIVPVVILAASARLVAVVAVPVRFPINVVAVTIPEKYPSPPTQSFDVGFVVPIPVFPEIVTLSSISVIPLLEFNFKFPEVL